MRGYVSGTARVGLAGVDRLDIDLRDVDWQDTRDRFAFQGLQGGVAWAPERTEARTLNWSGLWLYGVSLGSGRLVYSVAPGRMQLVEPLVFNAFGGEIRLNSLALALDSEGEPELQLSARLDQLDMSQISAAMGWPSMGGSLSGDLPSARLEDGVLFLDGALSMDVFDGQIEISALSIERPFGVLPTVAAQVILRNLDLKLVTGAFSFGEIQGRLEGTIADLRLVDWEPVQFDAELRTSPKAKPRRISQRAVNSLSSIGGGGAVAALQAGVLRVFESFGYEQIGLRCKMRNNRCSMSGVEPAKSGYYIVKGSGLPRLDVIGHANQVDWPELVERLMAATSGRGPSFD